MGDYLEFALFFYDTQEYMRSFLEPHNHIQETECTKLKEIESLYIYSNQKNIFESFTENKLLYAAKSTSIPLKKKINIIYASTSQITGSIYENPESAENIQKSKKVVEPILHTVFHNQNTIKSFIEIIGYDYYTQVHSLNVSIYSLCLGKELGLKEKDLRDLGRAALLHDIGKSKIEHCIIDKSDKLTKEEFKKVEAHPMLGYNIASTIGIKNRNILNGIRHHHEKLDGSGYPDKLSGSEITLFPRIISICDIFDALTTRRSYKKELHSYNAILLMKTYMKKHLDIKIIDVFIQMLHE